MNIIEIKELTKYYGKQLGIENVTFNVKEGEIFGFIGPNGAGKSTTIRTLLSLIYPTSGQAKIFDKDIIKYGYEIKKEIGYLPSEVFYYDNMKVIDILKYSASFYKKDCTKRMYELAEIMDLDLTKKVDDLSYGNKKKVGIVQGLLHEPKLLILDEPTSGLDPLMQQKFFNLILEENKKGTTVLFSSHILTEVQKLCHRVGIIKEGTMIRVDDIKALKGDNYKKFTVHLKDTSGFEIEGINNLSIKEDGVHFLYKGDINKVIGLLNTKHVDNLVIEEPTLEEIFMHYYV
ncbi:ABC transporter ATP-binding protein [Acidaminobacter sp. JC074]|uniref:ABC transporter ATP-binding protein n=1 Tax=Acidaminobacter sp. JC074 TaxID=2530199 RepID=UPI001F113F48|nr:ABC transporter ATP-binding protein [Acidaminobacter sp. JC074]MCH4889191.1 ABC transporter ATP-binding protein [Acidaminobacter sp. JC074]